MEIRTVIETIIAGCVTIGLIAALGLLMLVLVPEPIVAQGPDIPSREEFRKAHRYHGITWSYREGDTWYFDRDGQKCRVFNTKEK